MPQGFVMKGERPIKTSVPARFFLQAIVDPILLDD
jgi:hypothetical protein